MSYVDQVLQPGEKVAYATTLHWFIYLRAIVLLLIAAVLWIAFFFVADPDRRLAVLAGAGLTTIIGLFFWLPAFVKRLTPSWLSRIGE